MTDNDALSSSQPSQPVENVAETQAVEDVANSETVPEQAAAAPAAATALSINNESAALEEAITAAVEASSALIGTAVTTDADAVAQPMEIDTPAAPTTTTITTTTTTTEETTTTTTNKLAPTDRDVILGEGSAGHKMNLLLQDMIRLHRILWKLHDMPAPTKREEVQDMANHIIDLIRKGKSFELAGLKDVPRQFMKSTGRFFGPKPQTEFEEWEVLADDVVKETMCDIILEDFQVDDLGPLTEMPYKNLKEWISKKKPQDTTTTSNSVMPEGRDAILLPCENFLGEKMYEQQAGNKTIFSLASQLVTSYTNSPEKRVEAALYIMKGLDDAEVITTGEKDATTTSKTRYLIRTQREDQSISWEIMDAASAAEFTLIFTFEVYLEKEIHFLPPSQIIAGTTAVTTGTMTETSQMIEDYKAQQEAEVAAGSIGPITDPTEHDVLFGRGGMTNSHPGNKRFRDIIALHRPDYIRAVKMDKPAVARKIVQAIRYGTPPGRFLKKHDDNMWYDVGDRTAAEKTSQGLRERTNAEKRQRSALREALRIRKQDMVEDDETANKKVKSGVSAAELAAAVAPGLLHTLNYVGTNLPVPLSLSMKEPVTVPRKKGAFVTNTANTNGKPVSEELNTEGLLPNAVDEDGNILVTDYDILCGRGGLTNHHKGNKRFRDVVALHRPDYVRAPKIQKPSVARVIVRAIRTGDPPGRFLRKDEKTGKWIDVGDKKAAEKTSQALREKTTEERDKIKSGEAPPQGILVPGVTNAYLMADFSPASATPTTMEPASAAAATADATAAMTASELTTKEEEATKPVDDVEEKKEAVAEPGDVAAASSQGEKKSEGKEDEPAAGTEKPAKSTEEMEEVKNDPKPKEMMI